MQKFECILHLSDKILEISEFGDLVEIFALDNLEDWWQQFNYNKNEIYDLNLYQYCGKYYLDIYKTALNERDERITLFQTKEELDLITEE